MKALGLFKAALWVLAALAVGWGAVRLETERAGVVERVIETPAGDVRLYGPSDGPLVFVAHGFAGSTQLMQTISRDLARAGFAVAAFDFVGHGRHPGLLSADVTRIEGTTQQLVDQTSTIIDAVQGRSGMDGPIALVGHSMATDIIIRAADGRPDVAAIVAISMYSEAVTAEWPSRLLILSGAWETRLRAVAMEAVAQVDPTVDEGETAHKNGVSRRAAYAPMTEHLAVLYSPETLSETRQWLSKAMDHDAKGSPKPLGAAVLAVLIGLTGLASLAARLLPKSAKAPVPLSTGRALAVLLIPVLPAAGASILLGGAVLGIAAVGYLLVYFAVWGGLALLLLARFGRSVQWPDIWGVAMIIAIGLGLFATALDRYGAAFVPTGPRLSLMGLLLIGTLPFMLADRVAMFGAPLWQRGLARALPIGVLLAMMILGPADMGLLFTVLPVLVLFFVVYGTIGHSVAARVGPDAAGVGLGLCLAWAVAASIPLFAG